MNNNSLFSIPNSSRGRLTSSLKCYYGFVYVAAVDTVKGLAMIGFVLLVFHILFFVVGRLGELDVPPFFMVPLRIRSFSNDLTSEKKLGRCWVSFSTRGTRFDLIVGV